MGVDSGPAPTCETMGPEDTAAACGDGCDNDGNGFADCNEFDCCGVPGVTCAPGTACARDGGVRPCDMFGDENTAAACADGCDNDGNGFADCNDFDCCGLVACGAGTECEGSVPPCPTMGPEDTAAACADGCDNDHNGFGDCGDFDCCGLVTCGPTTACGRDGGMPMGGRCDGAATMENTAATCADGCSNDMDTFVDCNDFDCCSAVTCPPESACGRRPDAGPGTMCPGPRAMENTVAACSDGCSNDSDTFVDCDDFDCCSVVSCEPGTSCGDRPPPGMMCPGPRVPENTLVLCSDGCSNDDDGMGRVFADCEDFDCCDVRPDCGPTTACGRM